MYVLDQIKEVQARKESSLVQNVYANLFSLLNGVRLFGCSVDFVVCHFLDDFGIGDMSLSQVCCKKLICAMLFGQSIR